MAREIKQEEAKGSERQREARSILLNLVNLIKRTTRAKVANGGGDGLTMSFLNVRKSVMAMSCSNTVRLLRLANLQQHYAHS